MKKNQPAQPQTFKIPRETSSFDFTYWAAIACIVLIPILFLSPLAFDGKTFVASDTKQWMGSAHSLMEYNEKTGQQALWNSNMFSGMPGYMISLSNPVYGADSFVLQIVGKVLDWRILYLIFMGLGVFLFLRQYKIEPFLAAFASVAFQLSTYFIIILKVGHNSKFQAIAFIPWFFLALNYSMTNLKWYGGVFIALILSLQLRANHPQITYYTLIAGGIFFAFWLFDKLKDKEYKTIATGSLWIGSGIVFALFTIAFPYMLNYEYSKFTIRAGTVASGTSGLSTAYALSWSFDWLESATLFIPNYFGGHSPFYWGQMPFTEGPQYLGSILLILASLTFINKMSKVTVSLWIISLVVWVFSMGSNFESFSNLLLNYLPYYNKFRTPSMILVILSFTLPVLSVIGVKEFLVSVADKKNQAAFLKKFYILSGVILGLGLIFWVFGSGLPFSKPTDASRYDAQTIDRLISERHSLFSASMLRYFGFTVAAIIALFLAAKQTINSSVLGFSFLVLITIDLWSFDSQYVDRENLESKKTYSSTFLPTQTDNFLLQDKGNYRIYPVGSLFEQTRFCYYHQSLGGYHGAKLAVFQDLFDQCLNNGSNPQIPINFNLLTAFGVKYLVFGQLFSQPFENLTPVFQDEASRQTVVDYGGFRGKYFFVRNTQVVEKATDILPKMNDANWNPVKTAFIEKTLSEPVGYDSLATVTEKKFDLHEIEIEVSTSKTSFLYLSEIYYPAGWKAFVDGKETEIYKSNYAFRGVIVPEGKHTVRMEFNPTSYSTSKVIAGVSSVLLYGLGIFGLIVVFRPKKNA